MEINKSITLNATASLTEGELEKIVAYFSANVSDNKLGYNMNINVINKDLINSSEINKAAYKSQYDLFIASINENIII